jgi:glycosyltransferase involved in cell wall biosynthesis
VVIVTDSLAVDGGSSMVALTSARALAASGVRVTVFAASGEASPELAACENLTLVTTGQGDALASGNRLRGALRGLWNGAAFHRISDLLATMDRERTVVHVHGWTKALSSSVVAAVVRAKFPLVMTMHEYFVRCPTGCLYLHRDRAVCTLKPMSLACVLTDCDSRSYAFKLYRVVRQAIARTAGSIPRGARNFITVSAFSERILRGLLPAARRFYPVANPVDAVRDDRVAAAANDQFVYVGRLSPEKGGALLAEAAKRAGVRVTFIGDGPERAAIEAANPDATVTGWLDRDGVAARLRGARAIVVPSLWYETLGLVVLEAAALGIPAIVSRDTAPGDLVRDGETGLLFGRGDVAQLTAALIAMRDDAVVERMSCAAYDGFWSAPPTTEAHVTGLRTVYDQVLADALGQSAAAPSFATPARAAR